MKIVFAGTPDFAATALHAILKVAPDAGWTVPLVLTQPDRPAGRGLKLAPSPVRQLALSHEIEVAMPTTLRKGEAALAAHDRLRAIAPDVLVVAAYGLILPSQVLEIPRGVRAGWTPKLSAINIHASLLPRWRGAAPIVRAIEAGDDATGITLMQMDAGLDTGPMLVAEKIVIASDDTAQTLTSKLAQLGARMIVDALQNIDRLIAIPQPAGATYAAKVNKGEAWVDWSAPAGELERKVRALDPFPVASSTLNGATIKLWRVRVSAGTHNADDAGRVLAVDKSGVLVACGVGAVLITEMQRAGGKRVPAREFIAGSPIAAGDRFVSPLAVSME